MASDTPLKCKCGAVRGTAHALSPKTCNHLICHCKDCQAFARHLEPAALGPLGGLEIVQMSTGRLTFDGGADQIGCLRLSETGLYRWYTRCCRTPIGATRPTAGVPSIGMIHSFIDLPREELDAVAGPVLGHTYTADAPGNADEIAALPKASLRTWLRLYASAIFWKLRGDDKHHAFFPGGQPLAEPETIALS